jgi:hypothetical protein
MGKSLEGNEAAGAFVPTAPTESYSNVPIAHRDVRKS